MKHSTFERASAVFAAVCDLDPKERLTRLSELCGEDKALHQIVMDLLAADIESSWFLDREPDQGAGAIIVGDVARSLTGDGRSTVLPERLGHYRILHLLGEGGMGAVYEAEQDHPRRLVALKCMHPWVLDTRLQDHFHIEAQAMGRLLHPGIPQIYEAGHHGDIHFLAMERVRGIGLLAHTQKLDLAGRILLLIRIGDAIQHAHDHGVIHCDLKPANVLVTVEGQPKVLDFGIAAIRQQGQTRPLVGTPRYMSPEQLRGDTIPTPSWDVFALGVLGFQIISGEVPFPIRTRSPQDALAIMHRGPLPLHATPDPKAPRPGARAVASPGPRPVRPRPHRRGPHRGPLPCADPSPPLGRVSDPPPRCPARPVPSPRAPVVAAGRPQQRPHRRGSCLLRPGMVDPARHPTARAPCPERLAHRAGSHG